MKIFKFFIVSICVLTAVFGFSITAKAVTIQELMDQIAKLQAQLQAMQAQQDTTQKWCHTFNANIGMGQKTGLPEVEALATALQKEGMLEQGAIFPEGYDETLASAVTGFQEKYASEILTVYNLKHGTGYVGKSTRARLNALYGCKDKKECVIDSDCPQLKCASGDTKCLGSAYKCVDGRCVTTPTPQCTTDNDCPQVSCAINTDGTPNCPGPTKCIDGKCVIKPALTCTDSDGGKNYYVKGTTKDEVHEGNDFCSDIGTTLNEYYCSYVQKGTDSMYALGSTIFDCPNGCENGACKKDPLQPAITIISPNGGETYKSGGSITVNWKTANVSSSEKFNVIRLRAYPNGQEYNLAKDVLNDGQEVITIPSSVPEGAYTLEIKTYVNNVLVFDASDSYFKIVSTTTQPSITITSPNSGETWQLGSTQKITWSTNNIPVSNTMTIRLRGDDGVERYIYDQHGDSVAANYGEFTFLVHSNLPVGKYKAEVKTSVNTQSYLDASDNYFSIVAPTTQPSVTVTSPKGGEGLYTGQTYAIKWNSTGISASENIKIELSYSHNDPTWTAGNRFEDWIVEKTPNTGSYSWTIPEFYGLGLVSNSFSVKVSYGQTVAYSQKFNIKLGYSNPSLKMALGPIAGETYKPGDKIAISWTPYDSSSPYGMTLLKKNDISFIRWLSLYPDYNYSGRFYWTVPSGLSSDKDYYLRVDTSKTASRTNVGYSNVFTISNPTTQPSITVTFQAAGGYIGSPIPIQAGTTVDLKWTSTNANYCTLNASSTDTNFTGGATQLSSTSGITTVQPKTNVTYSVTCSDSAGRQGTSNSITFQVSSNPTQPSITITSPNGGEEWLEGVAHNITWNSNGLNTIDIAFNTTGSGSVPTLIERGVSASLGLYSWKIPSNFLLDWQKREYFIIATKDFDKYILGDQSGWNAKKVTIVSPTASQSSITVTSPNGGEKLIKGQNYNITWKATGVDKVYISVMFYESPDDTGRGGSLITGPIDASSGSYIWNVSESSLAGGHFVGSYFKISVNAGYGIVDQSDNYFSIVAPATTYCSQFYSKLTASYNKKCGDATYDAAADVDKDKAVGFMDLGLYSDNKINETWCKEKLNATTSPCATAQPSITVLSPNGGETLVIGSSNVISWTGQGLSTSINNYHGSNNIDIELTKGGGLYQGLNDYCSAISINSSGGSANCVIPLNVLAGADYKIATIDNTAKVSDASNNYFSVVAPAVTTPATTYCSQFYAKFLASYQKSCGNTAYDPVADVDKSKKVDLGDYSFYAAYGKDEAWCQQKLSETTSPCELGYNDLQLMSISNTLASIAQKIKELLGL